MKNRLFILTFLFIHASIVSIQSIDEIFINGHLYVQMLCCISSIGVCFNNGLTFYYRYKKLNRVCILFFISCCISTFLIWQQPPFHLASPFTSLLYALKVISSLFVIEYVQHNKMSRHFLSFIFKIICLYLFIADISVLRLPIADYGGRDICFLGNKFTLSYLHLFMCPLFYKLYRPYERDKTQNKILYFLILAWVAYISFYVQCTTVLIAPFIILLCHIVHKYIYNIVSNFLFVISSILILDIGMLIYFALLIQNDVFNQIIFALGEDSSLTGRTIIWNAIISILPNRPLWGFGPANSTYVVGNLLGLTNAQNGLIDAYLSIGAIGLVLYFYVLYSIYNLVRYNKENLALYYFLVCLVIFSVVEITIDERFLVYASFLLLTNYKKESQCLIQRCHY